jgi:alpha,alpha-trehalase
LILIFILSIMNVFHCVGAALFIHRFHPVQGGNLRKAEQRLAISIDPNGGCSLENGQGDGMESSRIKKHVLSVLSVALLLASLPYAAAPEERASPLLKQAPLVSVDENLYRLLEEEDTDGDKKVTVDDPPVARTERGDKRFWVVSRGGMRYHLVGTYYLSNLLKELKLAQDLGFDEAPLLPERIFENPVRQVSRSIREIYWDGLTRRIDEEHLESILKDEKTATGGRRYLYVPHDDAIAREYFDGISKRRPDLKFDVAVLPVKITPEYVRGLGNRHGILSLALQPGAEGGYAGVPFVVPGGRFNEMYGWDSYFEALGLLRDGRLDLARAMVDNFVYQIEHYGKILNANRTYYLTRSQPPFLTSMALAVYGALPKDAESKRWLKKVFQAAILEYQGVWMNEEHLTATGLSRYFGRGLGPPPEVEPGHFDEIYQPFAESRGMDLKQFEVRYQSGEVKIPKLDRFFVHDRCVRESGHDTTYRWEGDRCADFVTVDLNSLLYKTEIDIARTIQGEFGGTFKGIGGASETSSEWYRRAAKRKSLITKYLWDERSGMFFDYDLSRERRYPYVSATTFYPMWACHKDDPQTRLLTKDQAARLVASALPQLEMPGGVAASAEQSRGPLSTSRPARQWDFPYGWPPHQMIIWEGMQKYGFDTVAQRLAYRWLYTITRNAADYNGTIPEKMDVVKRSHQVFAEYGNVGTKFSYITREGFGWMNASYQVGLSILSRDLKDSLERLIPPEWIFAGE